MTNNIYCVGYVVIETGKPIAFHSVIFEAKKTMSVDAAQTIRATTEVKLCDLWVGRDVTVISMSVIGEVDN